MILVVGGRGSGKRDFAKSAYAYGDDDIAAAVLDERPVLADLQEMLCHCNVEDDELVERLSRKAVVICDEVGCGVVPVDPAERAWRDRVGRVCCRLAARADTVVRLCCGIPRIIKGGG